MTPSILIVDDHPGWRGQVRSIIESRGEYRVAGEAGDGREACEQAAALAPHLVLMDVELPGGLNGIDTAARIIEADPASRILFLSGHRSWDVIEAALMTGARGYVHKLSAAQDLERAMRKVADGARFVSPALGGRRGDVEPQVHEVCFFSSEPPLLDAYEAMAAAALRDGKTVMHVLSPEREQRLWQRLDARGFDLQRIARDGRYIAVGVDAFLAQLMSERPPTEQELWRTSMALVLRGMRASQQGRPGVAAFGEGADRLWRTGKVDMAALVERVWNDVGQLLNVDVLCGYATPSGIEIESDTYRHICAVHSAAHTR